MKRILALTLCILTLFLCACQPTPEVEPVPNKGDDVMGEKIHTTPVPKTPSPTSEADQDPTGEPDVTEVPFVIPHIDVPDHWTEEMTLPGGTKIYIDADIEYEDAAHPVYLIRDAEHFDGPTLKKVIDFFSTHMQWRPVDSTRQELIDKLEELMKEPDPDVVYDDYYTDPEDKSEEIAEIIKKLQELDPDVPWKNIDSPEDIPKGSYILSDGYREYHTNQMGTSFYISGYDTREYVGYSEVMILQQLDEQHKEIKLPVPSVTEEEAVNMANAFVREVGLSYHLKLANVSVAGRVKMSSNKKLYAYGWMVTYGLNAEGGGVLDLSNFDLQGWIHGTDEGNTPPPQEASYRPDKKMEQFSVYIENGELMEVLWSDPQELISVENPAVELMPFDEIKERIKDRISYGLSRYSDKKFMDIHIDKIALVYLKSSKANTVREYYYSPMWCFTNRAESPYLMPLQDGINFINAIDGTFVDVDVYAK